MLGSKAKELMFWKVGPTATVKRTLLEQVSATHTTTSLVTTP